MIKCSECGYENMDGLDYCDGCGAKLNAAAGAPAAAAGAAPAAPAEGAPAEAPQAEAPGAGAPKAEAAAAPTAEAPAGEAPAAEVPKSEAPTGELNKPAAAPAPAPADPAAPAAAFKAKFTVVRGGRKGQEFPLEDGNNLIGRWDPETGSFPEVDPDADDPEAKISRRGR